VLLYFEDIPKTGLSLEQTNESKIPSEEITGHRALRCSVLLSKTGKRVRLDGHLELLVDLLCDRCLDPFEWELTSDFQIEFAVQSPEQAGYFTTDYLCSREDLDLVFVDEPQIDLFEVLRQQFFLSLPDKRLCSEECPGICPGCGAQLNAGNGQKTTIP